MKSNYNITICCVVGNDELNLSGEVNEGKMVQKDENTYFEISGTLKSSQGTHIVVGASKIIDNYKNEDIKDMNLFVFTGSKKTDNMYPISIGIKDIHNIYQIKAKLYKSVCTSVAYNPKSPRQLFNNISNLDFGVGNYLNAQTAVSIKKLK